MTRFGEKRCRHFNGIQNKQCRAGISYSEVVSKISLFPCFADEGAKSCASYIAPTSEEIAQEQIESRRIADLFERGLSNCCIAPLDMSQVIPKGQPHAGHGPRICSKCRKVAFVV